MFILISEPTHIYKSISTAPTTRDTENRLSEIGVFPGKFKDLWISINFRRLHYIGPRVVLGVLHLAIIR